jgi:uncharacterized protein with WD repeat
VRDGLGQRAPSCPRAALVTALRSHSPVPSLACRASADVKLYWHPQGTYLAVKVEAWTKTKKSTTTSFQIFCVKDKDVPLEVRSRCEVPVRGSSEADLFFVA